MTKGINRDRRWFLLRAGATLAVSQVDVFGAAAMPLFGEGTLPSLSGATEWLNSQPLKSTDLRGKVVLIDFWTYTCINWRRTLPYIRAWDAKYRKHGLVVIGVHTPEFAFERDLENVRQAVKGMRIDYPVAVDTGYAVWRAFDNEYWPALYLADAQGRVRYHKFGEGDYERSESTIQQLLNKAGAQGIVSGLVSLEATGAEADAAWSDLQSVENYVGYERTENFASRGGFAFDRNHDYTAPDLLKLNQWALAGNWTAQKQKIVLNAANGRIVYQFHSRDLHLVMGPAAPETPARFRIRLNGQLPGVAHGADIDEQGKGTITEPRMYQLIRQPKPIADQRFEIEFLDAGVEVFSFTFG